MVSPVTHLLRPLRQDVHQPQALAPAVEVPLQVMMLWVWLRPRGQAPAPP